MYIVARRHCSLKLSVLLLHLLRLLFVFDSSFDLRVHFFILVDLTMANARTKLKTLHKELGVLMGLVNIKKTEIKQAEKELREELTTEAVNMKMEREESNEESGTKSERDKCSSSSSSSDDEAHVDADNTELATVPSHTGAHVVADNTEDDVNADNTVVETVPGYAGSVGMEIKAEENVVKAEPVGRVDEEHVVAVVKVEEESSTKTRGRPPKYPKDQCAACAPHNAKGYLHKPWCWNCEPPSKKRHKAQHE